jgi:hypothetical protein
MHQARVSAGQEQEQAGMSLGCVGSWFNMGEQSNEVA